MGTITIEEAQAHLPEVIGQLLPGQAVTITDEGRPSAQIKKTERPRHPSNDGSADTYICVRSDIDRSHEDRNKPGAVHHRYTPAGFQKLWHWWLALTATSVLMPLIGVLSLTVAEIQRVAVRSPYGSTYTEYTPLGDALGTSGGVILAGTPLAIIAAMIVWCVLLFRFWNLVQDGYARTTPGQAVGFLFIPFFNLYWIPVAIHGLVVEFNNYPRRHGGPMDITPVSTGLGVCCSILVILMMIPYFNLLTVIPTLVVLIMLTSALKKVAVALLDARCLPPTEVAPTIEYQQSATT